MTMFVLPLDQAVDRAMESSKAYKKSKSSIALLVFESVVAAAVLVIVALNYFLGLGYVVLAESVSSDLPAGTLAVTSTVDAAALEVGDVVTVDSASGGLATYSITGLAPSSEEAVRVVTVGADAAGDAVALQLATADRVVFAAPGMGNIAATASGPALTAFAALLVLGAFVQLGGSKTSKARVQRRAHVAKAA